ncbi:nucleotidyltransferase domain-containing protein [Microbacterium sp. Mu-80]|uniref:Nucleotidyltransferase domain-containing protein n=1 Tax=Microbacterium bandirmense TaxID=3122050 RepID=A0ABU8LAY6_9MICO
MNFLAVAERFAAQHFPEASVVVLAGSTARGTRTSTSDIDLLILGETLFADGRTSLAATYRFEGEVFEVFAYTEEGFSTWANRGFEQYRPVIVQMLLDGVTVRGAAERERYKDVWSPKYEAGPSLEPSEAAFRRYVITDLLDDYSDVTDPVERHVIATLLYERTAELVLLTNSRWIGTGKYLPRRLAEFDPDRAAALAAHLVSGDHDLFAEQVKIELDRAGGRVQEGFQR